tara:strand:+ start:220 stop:477 length:258 start_codon:yes stop_codon:yes gene_type:complete
MEPNMEADLVTVMNFINNHELKDEIIQWYLEGPPDDVGFMWCQYDTPAKKCVEQLVLYLGYDSSGFGIMQRKIQLEIRKKEQDKK